MAEGRRGRKRCNSGSSSCSILSELVPRTVSPDDVETGEADVVSPTPRRQKSPPESSRRTRHRRWKQQLNQPYLGDSNGCASMFDFSERRDSYSKSKAASEGSATAVAEPYGSTSERYQENLRSLDNVLRPETAVEDGLLDYILLRPDSTAQPKIQRALNEQALEVQPKEGTWSMDGLHSVSHGPVSTRDISFQLNKVKSQSSDLESAMSEFTSNNQHVEVVNSLTSPLVAVQADINEIKGDVQRLKADLKQMRADVDDLKKGEASTQKQLRDLANPCFPSKLASSKD